MSFSRPIHWYHSHADPIWPDDTFKSEFMPRNLDWNCRSRIPSLFLFCLFVDHFLDWDFLQASLTRKYVGLFSLLFPTFYLSLFIYFFLSLSTSNLLLIYYLLFLFLKVVGNQKVGGSIMCQSVLICLGPRRSKFFSLSILLLSSIWFISVSAPVKQNE